jgi:hypothetical protein
VISILDSNERSLLHGNRCDAGTHESSAENSDFLDGHDLRNRSARRRRHTRILLECSRREKDVNQLATHIGHRHLAKQARLGAITVARSAAISRFDCIDCSERRRIIPARLLHCLFARLLQHNATTCGIFVEKESGHSAAVFHMLHSSVGELRRALNCNLSQDRRMHELVDEAHLHRFLRANVLAGQNHVEGGAHSDEPRQTLRPTCTGNETDLNFRKCKHCLRMISRDAIVCSQ